MSRILLPPALHLLTGFALTLPGLLSTVEILEYSVYDIPVNGGYWTVSSHVPLFALAVPHFLYGLVFLAIALANRSKANERGWWIQLLLACSATLMVGQAFFSLLFLPAVGGNRYYQHNTLDWEVEGLTQQAVLLTIPLLHFCYLLTKGLIFYKKP